jgi:putative redox protein
MSGQTQQVTLTWSEGMRFEGRTSGGAVTPLDGDGSLSPSPTQLLLESLGGCAGIDVVEILRKGRQGLEDLTVEVEGTRREGTPRRFIRIDLRFVVRGDVARSAAERAVDLSLERYCSVFHTLRKDLAVETEVVLEG